MSATTDNGLIPQETIDRAARTLLEGAPAGSEVILFGSYARGDARGGDLDSLVVEPSVTDRHAEMVRLREALRHLDVPADVLVTSRAFYEAWKDGSTRWSPGRTVRGGAMPEVPDGWSTRAASV